jgi:L-iditol 2-dehydrogenase
MKSLVLAAYKQFRIEERPEPAVGPDDVLVRVRACGICGSDVHGFDGGSGRRIPPVVMGHEAAGVVERAGTRVDDLRSGDPVVFDSMIWCGACGPCRGGSTNLCERRRVLGVSCDEYRQDGAFAEFVAVPRRIVYRLPADLAPEQAALVEPTTVAVHAVGRSPGAGPALVVGAGMIGLLVVQVLRAERRAPIFCTDIDEGRLALARRVGADETFHAERGDPAAEILKRTGGRGVATSFEAVGTTAAVRTAVAAVRRGGAVVLIGNVAPSVDLALQAVVTRELSLLGSCGSAGEYPRCIELMASGRIDVRPLISAVAPLEEGPAWFDRLHRREPGLLKVVLKP